MKNYIVPGVFSLMMIACGASVPYRVDYPLTKKEFYSRDSIFSGRIPQGWFSSDDEELASAHVVWLIRDDFSATLAFKELKLDELSKKRVNDEGLILLARLSFSLQQSNPLFKTKEIELHEFEVNSKKFCGYEMNFTGALKRVIVFEAKGKFYECEARIVKGSPSLKELEHLYTVQQTLLTSLTF
ncbi:MAG: hypothetical protein HY707_08840 [Ignavibacteriae bacterium]|nr:hypothetical protein [Ignavibacteriota bacterium]